jgi:archaellum biogenesis protein FlaJ (TadC family)
MTLSERAVEQMQHIMKKYPSSTVYIVFAVTIILILQIVSFFRGY